MVLARFLPRNEEFFVLFEDAAKNAAEAAETLRSLIEQHEDIDRKVRLLRDLEHRGDEITHRVFNALNSTFVTPLDREDIRDLASELDDFIDYIEEAGKRVALYRIDPATEMNCLLVRIITEQAAILAKAIPQLEDVRRGATELRHAAVEVNRLENEADDTLSQALATLYDGVDDIPSIIRAIRLGEIYEILEEATDRAEKVVNTVEGIVLKYA